MTATTRIANAGLEDLVAAVRLHVKDDAGLYKAFGLKAPAEVDIRDFEPARIADEAVRLGCLPPPELLSREQALQCLRDAAEAITPAMSPIERHDFLSDIGFLEELERIEALLVARRSGAALDRLSRFIRPVWMAKNGCAA